jgi:hypothetical protein
MSPALRRDQQLLKPSRMPAYGDTDAAYLILVRGGFERQAPGVTEDSH